MKFTHNNKDYPITITRKKVKNLNLRIQKSGEIRISIPHKSTLEFVQQVLKQNDAKIRKMLDGIEGRIDRDKRLAKQHGKYIWIIGKRYEIEIREGDVDKAQLIDNKVIVTVNNLNHPMLDAYRDIVLWKYIVKEHQHYIFDVYKDVKRRIPDLVPEGLYVQVKDYKSKWGTCYPFKNKITLSLYLLHYPLKSIEYIIIHELAHFKHHNHSKEFYQYIELFMPDWKQHSIAFKDPVIKSSLIDLKKYK